jgi:hypothetical protein
MIHYHGTPIGGTRDGAARFLMARHALIPFKRQDDLLAAMEVCQSFVLDNSAYSYWRAGEGDVDAKKYMQWVNSLAGHPSLDWCLIPDKIDGTEDQNKAMVNEWMDEGCGVDSVPVYHLHESLEWLDWLVCNFRVIAIGSSGSYATPGTASWWNRISEVMDVCCNSSGVPRCKLHGLRMLDPEIFSRIPLASADSTNAAVNSGSITRFGMYVPPTTYQRASVIADRIEANNSAMIWTPGPKQVDIFS